MSNNRDSDVSTQHDLAWLLDNSIRLPGGYRIGIDGIIGLIPGVGDAVGGLLSLYILASARRLKVPRIVMVRMGLNILVDSIVGAIPIVGDIFDFVWKANTRNAMLLRAYELDPENVTRKSTESSAITIIGFVLAVGVFIGVLVFAISGLLHLGRS